MEGQHGGVVWFKKSKSHRMIDNWQQWLLIFDLSFITNRNDLITTSTHNSLKISFTSYDNKWLTSFNRDFFWGFFNIMTCMSCKFRKEEEKSSRNDLQLKKKIMTFKYSIHWRMCCLLNCTFLHMISEKKK